jgi:DNA-binding transcriptional ArsR family regulator
MNKVFRALSDPTRRKVLQLLRQREMNAGEIAEHFPHAKPTLSRHFAVLREADLIDGDKRGNAIVYRLNVSVLEEALMGFMDFFRVKGRDENGNEAEPKPSSSNEDATRG